MVIDVTELKAQVCRVHDTRQLLAQAQERLRAAEVVLELTSEYQKVLDIKSHIKMLISDVQTEEEYLRMNALTAFKETGDKAPVSGVTVKQFKRVDFNPAEAMAWCKIHAPALVKEILDPGYARIAENLEGAPIEVKYESRVQIATDLSKAVTE